MQRSCKPQFSDILHKHRTSDNNSHIHVFKDQEALNMKEINIEEDKEEETSPVLKSKISRKKSSMCLPGTDNIKSQKRLYSTALQNCVPSSLDKVKSLTFSANRSSVSKEPCNRSLMSPSHKKIKNCRRISCNNSSLVPEESVLIKSPASAFLEKDDSLLESLDFSEIDSLCSSASSTPKRGSIASHSSRKLLSSSNDSTLAEHKRSPLYDKSNICRNILKVTPKRCDRSHESEVETNRHIIDQSEIENYSVLSEHNINSISFAEEFGRFSPDLFEENESSDKQFISESENRNVCQNEIEFFDKIEDIFQDSFSQSDSEKPHDVVAALIDADKEKDSKNDRGDSQANESQVKDSKNSTGDSQANESQVSFCSTIESQPLIARVQNKLEDCQSSQSSVIFREKERREELVSAAVKKAEKVHEFEIGPFFGLPSVVAEVLKKHRGIADLYDWQKECVTEGSGTNNLLFSLPTSGGKTLVAEILMLRQLLLKKKDVLFVLPYVALVQEKVHGLSPFGVELGFLIEEYAASRGSYPPKSGRKKHVLYIATIEKASGLVNSLIENNRIGELGLVVVDEVHMIGELSGRGAVLEGMIAKLKYAAKKVQLIAMSATIGNLSEVASFLEAKLYTGDFRPVKLSEYVKIGDQIWELNQNSKTEEELLYKQRMCCFNYNDQQKKIDTDMIGGLVAEVVPQHSCIVFCPTRRNCEALAKLICLILPEEIKRVRHPEKVSLYRAIIEESGGTICPTLRKTIPFGIAYHHSGLTEGERHLIEEGYLNGTLCCICCTSTLAAGVNLPARRVIIRSPYTGKEFLTPSRYKQMVGRAGRAGLDTCGESFLILKSNDLRLARNLLLSPIDNCQSALLLRDNYGLVQLLFSSVGLEIASTLKDLKALASLSLMSIQSKDNHVDPDCKVVEVMENLHKKGFVRIKTDPTSKVDSVPPSALSCENSNLKLKSLTNESEDDRSAKESLKEVASKMVNKPLEDMDVLTLSRLGRAAVKGNIDIDLAKELYSDLIKARENLAVNCYLHLLYLVIPYDMVNSVNIDPYNFCTAVDELGEEELKVAKVLGISEGTLTKLRMGQKSERVPRSVLQRFYVASILYKLWSGKSIWEVSIQFQMDRGYLQQVLLASSSFASCMHHFCQELEELWAFRELLCTFARQLNGCCVPELLPLMDLPAVKKGRASMLYKAGFRTLHDIANAEPRALANCVEHLPIRTAGQIVNSAKMLLLEKVESLQGEAEEVLLGLHQPSTANVVDT